MPQMIWQRILICLRRPNGDRASPYRGMGKKQRYRTSRGGLSPRLHGYRVSTASGRNNPSLEGDIVGSATELALAFPGVFHYMRRSIALESRHVYRPPLDDIPAWATFS